MDDAFTHTDVELFNTEDIDQEVRDALLAKGWKTAGDLVYNPLHWREGTDADHFSKCMWGEEGQVCALTREALEYVRDNG